MCDFNGNGNGNGNSNSNFKFSIDIGKKRVKLYKCSQNEYQNIVKHNIIQPLHQNLLCQTFYEDEITLYVYVDDDNKFDHFILSKMCVTDEREYHLVTIYEDVPGIDHVGIIYHISSYFLKESIPILYINTYGNNLVLISDEMMEKAMKILNMMKI